MPDFFQVRGSDWARQIERARREYVTQTRRAALWATDQAAKLGRAALAEKIRSVGLGRLGGAVGQTSTLKTGSTRGIAGVVFARGSRQSDNRGAGALEAYSRGAVITAVNGTWLAFPTNAIPKMVMSGGRRRRMTPETYTKSGFGLHLGTLQFRPVGNGRAILVAKKVVVSPKTGRAKPAGVRPSRTQINAKEVVVFVLIRVTARAKRFDEKQVLFEFAKEVPALMQQYLAKAFAGR